VADGSFVISTKYRLAPYWRKFIAELMKAGQYADASEVIEAGLAALEREQESFKLFVKGASNKLHP
jgi:putative addiction module CopG family antidote